MISFKHRGTLDKTTKFLKRASSGDYLQVLNYYGQQGVNALSSATPYDTGTTASSWDYEITQTPEGVAIYWTNSNINDGVPIAVILQYGHGTRNGGYVQGRDYINPAMAHIFDKIATEAWKEVTRR